jgi:hypothetical protein
MPALRLLTGLVMLLPGIMPVGAVAQNADRVTVARVDFRPVRLPLAPQREWIEIMVELEARPADGAAGQVTGRMRVTLELSFEFTPEGAERRFEFYRTSAEVVGFMAGRNAVRFYLPPERVRRDALRGAPKYWRVLAAPEVSVPALPAERFSETLADATVRRSFEQRVSGGAAKNHGVLLPQYLTPFAGEYPENTPTYTRVEAGR